MFKITTCFSSSFRFSDSMREWERNSERRGVLPSRSNRLVVNRQKIITYLIDQQSRSSRAIEKTVKIVLFLAVWNVYFAMFVYFWTGKLLFSMFVFHRKHQKIYLFLAFATMWLFVAVFIALHSSIIVIIDLSVQYTRIVWKVKESRAFNKFRTYW